MTATNPLRLPFNRPLAKTLESCLGLTRLIELYDRWQQQTRYQDQPIAEQFLKFALNDLNVTLDLDHSERLQHIPTSGPAIFFANHPFGGIEGMLLTQLLLKHRPDLKVLTNELLSKLPEFNDAFIGADVLSKNSSQRNSRPMKTLCRHLASGGAILIFPAGTVASIAPTQGKIIERPWKPMLGKLAARYNATCMPFYVEGNNSRTFYGLGLIYRKLRTALLIRELTNKQNTSIKVIAGSVIEPKELAAFSDSEALTDFLRLSCESMKTPTLTLRNDLSTQALTLDPIESTHRHALSQQLHTLTDCRLISKGNFDVYCAPYSSLGPLMTEIAICRERTFRAVGEGTGQSLDSDNFDPDYLHLFIWDTAELKIAGAYRVGRCDDIIKNNGVKGLYSRSLFHYNEDYIQRLGGALEVGRSFVTGEYQGNPRALDLLWQGIGRYIVQNPQYHTLFGCVSISNEYKTLARAFLSDTMLNRFPAKAEFLTDIRAVSPFLVKGKVWSTKVLSSLSNIAIINKLLGNFDHGMVIPILLRHYLALNGRFVAFSVNHDFNQALDGLILVDLRDSPEKYLHRYLGAQGSKIFINQWKQNEAVA